MNVINKIQLSMKNKTLFMIANKKNDYNEKISKDDVEEMKTGEKISQINKSFIPQSFNEIY